MPMNKAYLYCSFNVKGNVWTLLGMMSFKYLLFHKVLVGWGDGGLRLGEDWVHSDVVLVALGDQQHIRQDTHFS